MIKKISFIVLTVIIILNIFSPTETQAYGDYYFDRFDVDVIVAEDYTFHITETISTVFTYEKHGIYRELPNYWGEDKIKYSDITVEGAPYLVQNDKYSTKIRIGDPDKTVIGEIIYTISYTVNLPIDPSDTMDAVYINLIGFDHPTQTNNSTITIALPKKVDPANISVVSGYYFGSGYDDKIEYKYIYDRILKIRIISPLETYEGITAKINLPEGYFTNVRNPFFLDEFLKYFLPALLVLAALIIWAKYGNDEPVIMPVEVSPPDVSPVEAGYIIDGTINDEDISSMLIYWASLGFIKIEQAKGRNKYNFYKINDITNRPKYETDIFNSIFKGSSKDTHINTNSMQSKMAAQISAFNTGIKAKYNKPDKLIDKTSKSFSVVAAMLAYICYSLIAFFYGYYDDTGLGIFLALLSMPLFIPLHLMLKKILRYFNKRILGKSIIRLIPFLALAALYWLIISSTLDKWMLDALQIAVILLASCILVVISFYTQKLSQKGHEIFERVMGFRHFMITAEKDWIEEMAEETPEYFYNMLPYALVLGVSKVWIGKFANSVQAPPEWYNTAKTTSHYSSRTFSSNIVSDFSRIGVLSAKSLRATRSSYRSYSSSSSGSRSSYSYRPSSSYSSSRSSSSFSSSSSRSGGGFGGGGSSSW